MKTSILLGLLVAGALLAPVVSAHVVILAPNAEGECTATPIGSPRLGPHVTVWAGGCGPGAHTGPTLP